MLKDFGEVIGKLSFGKPKNKVRKCFQHNKENFLLIIPHVSPN
jgi:hypothetical protein